MKHKTILAVVALLGGLVMFTSRAASQEKPGAQAAGQGRRAARGNLHKILGILFVNFKKIP